MRYPSLSSPRPFPYVFWLVVLALSPAVSVRSASSQETLTAEELKLIRSAEQARVQAIEKVFGAVVAIYGDDRAGGGSGVIIDPSGLALTNHHVIMGAGVSGWGGLADGKLYRWDLVGTDPGGDVALIQLKGQERFPYARVGDSDTVRVGDWSLAMGNPFILAEDQKPTVTLGIVSGVKRYQYGAGGNTLVYGNCIQTDSSINPGNSGGPLFNMRGDVIGINGRGSFKARGRVNVGLGYAISSNQIRNFVPDLLATKLIEHGTLDARFGVREGKVVCETINLDSQIAELGMELGDRLVAFEGLPIRSSNQFTNLICTLPQGWPAEITFEKPDGTIKTAWLRLIGLPYTPPPPESRPKPRPKKDKDKEKDPQKQKQQQRQREKAQALRKLLASEPGTILNRKQNQHYLQQLVSLWRAHSYPNAASSAKSCYRWTEVLLDPANKQIGNQETFLTTDGRFRLTIKEQGGSTKVYAYDGSKYWESTDDGPREVSLAHARANPLFVQTLAISAMMQQRLLDSFGDATLDGGDKAQRQVAYRLKTVDADGDWFYFWLRYHQSGDPGGVTMLKAGNDLDCEGGAVTFSDWRLVNGLRLPHRRALVRDLSETLQVEAITQTIEGLPSFDPSLFSLRQISEDAGKP